MRTHSATETYYQILGVQPTATKQEITKAFHKLALRWHPDKNLNNTEEANEQFKLIGEAFETLRDEQRRRDYDTHLAAQNQTAQPSQRQRRHHGRRRRRHQAAAQEESSQAQEEAPQWERRETSREDVEALLRLAALLLDAYLKEQKRRKELGKQLAEALREGRTEEISQLIEEGAFLNEWSEEGFSCIHYAAQREDQHLLTYLLDAGANVNAKSADGKTALHFAVIQNNYELCHLLVSTYRAETHHQDSHNQDTPLHYAIENSCDHRIQELLIANSTYYTWFFSQYSALDCQDLLKDTPLHLALKTRQFDTVWLLLNKNVRTDLKNREGSAAIDLMLQMRSELPIRLSTWLSVKFVIEEPRQRESNCLVM